MPKPKGGWKFQSWIFLVGIINVLFHVKGVYVAALEWKTQYLGDPFGGQHTGVAVFDLNNDGRNDLLISAGRHSKDQSFVLINLGFNANTKTFIFSDPLSLGKTGGYYQVDVAPLSSLPQGHFAVLLAGGTCTVSSSCVAGTHEPAVLLDVSVSGCSVHNPNGACRLTSNVIWQETPATGNRNGALSSVLTNGGDPAIVLVGGGCLTVHHPVNGVYPKNPDYVLLAEDKVDGDDDEIDRAAGLAVGYIGKQKGIIIGPRSPGSRGPAPDVVVYQRNDGSYEHWNIETGNRLLRHATISTQTTGIALADLNDDGNVDIVKAGWVPSREIRGRIPQGYILVDEDPQDDVPLSLTSVMRPRISARSVATGNIYPDSPLPDIVYGMDNGDVVLFANQGSSNGRGFDYREFLDTGMSNCQIRDLTVVSLHPCTISVVCAITCGSGIDSGNVLFTSDQPNC